MPPKKCLRKKRELAKKMGARNAKIANTIFSNSPSLPLPPNTNLNDEEKNDGTQELTSTPANRTSIARELQRLNNDVREQPNNSSKDSGNRIVHWDSLKSLVSSNAVCKLCGSEIAMSEKTIGVATQVSLCCRNIYCGVIKKNYVRRTNYVQNNFRIDSSESYALNCQFVLALMQTGCGASEASVNLTFLDLPHASTFQKSTFPRVQSAIRPFIKALSEKIMREAREKEVLTTIGQEKFIDWKEKKIPAKDVKLTISYDMGWNKRSSGNKYDSMSGHGFVLGGETKKIYNTKCCRSTVPSAPSPAEIKS